MTDNSELKRAASSAKNWGGEVGEGRWYAAECFKRPYFSAQDAEFIAACDPGRVLALIAENDHLAMCARQWEEAAMQWGAERDQLRAEVAGLKTGYEAYERVNAELKAENEVLKKRIDDMSPFKGAPLTGPDLKCLACGEYHYGLQGLPCPNMRITASAALGQGEQP